jgi:type III restriction enzyme
MSAAARPVQMSNPFFDKPILNSPYERPVRHWELDADKASTMRTYWVPGVNHLGTHGRWAFAEFCDVWEIDSEFKTKVESHFDQMIEKAVQP